MATVFDVAKYILEQAGSMSTWKLQKLCYYAQAWSIAWGDGNLFEEDFQAWSNGPVCPELFHQHQGMFTIDAGKLPVGDSSALTELQREDIDIILKDYGSRAPYDLREQSHSEAPWISARGDLQDGDRSTRVITKESMGEYYGEL